MMEKLSPGQVRDAIYRVLSSSESPMTVYSIEKGVASLIGPAPSSSIRSYLRLNTPRTFLRLERGLYSLRERGPLETDTVPSSDSFVYGKATLFLGDCFEWLKRQPQESVHAVVTDPPYGLFEYSDEQQAKLKSGKGGVWRIPPSFDGHTRSPLPRFTTLTSKQLETIRIFFRTWGELLLPVLVPGAHVLVASSPLLSYILSGALAETGLEHRGEIIRLTTTMRGGDRPKGAHEEFPEVSVMPRSMWEPWVIFRKPLEGRAQDNLRKWKTGAFRRPDKNHPFGDVIKSGPTRPTERRIASHPSLKPQAFLREITRAVLPFGKGVVLDTFAGAGSTLAAAEYLKYTSVGIEKAADYFDIARKAIPELSRLQSGNL